MLRQGDVYIKTIDAIEGKAIGKDNYVVAEGEVTGHRHLLLGDFMMYKGTTGELLCEVLTEATLTHEEHAPHVLTKGKYAISIQRNFDLVEGVRRVAD